jgi:dephospho-CoA kinase
VRVRVCAPGSASWRAALLRRDWLRADTAARAQCAGLTTVPGAAGEAARRRWEEAAAARAEDWAASSGWTPSSDG